MIQTVDTKGLSCPQPVILTRKALQKHNALKVIVDNTTSLENVKRLAEKEGCNIETEDKGDGSYHLILTRDAAGAAIEASKSESPATTAGPTVIVISEDRMGRGNDELGYVLIRAFFHTLLEIENLPDMIIFYNTGVRLTEDNSEVIDDLRELENLGVEILICGTCTNYLEISDRVSVGTISNMYDIATYMTGAGRLVTP